MGKYTAFCIDTGNYETREIPQTQSTRVYRLRADNDREAQVKAHELLLNEFGDDAAEWRVFVTNSCATFFSEGIRIPIDDKVN